MVIRRKQDKIMNTMRIQEKTKEKKKPLRDNELENKLGYKHKRKNTLVPTPPPPPPPPPVAVVVVVVVAETDTPLI